MSINPREILDRADHLRRTASAAESVRVAIRLGSKPRLVTRHLFGAHETTLDVHETSAVYEALADVRNRLDDEAERLEQRVTATEAPA